ncbi:MAG: D-glycero-beta-D-manno-heptose-7-phosphate kinase [Flammeovirgaceae bacterium]|nr:D-glycero-beta-D-manno-heptose-7-phosphate kinase [Flammeovirgaceae bacterium]
MIMKIPVDKIFRDFNSLRVLVIGDIMLDNYIWGNVARISPEAPVPIVQVKKRDVRLGGAANVALNLKALGATPILVALIGKDEYGNKLMNCLAENKISKEGVVISTDRPTTVKTRVIASHQHVVRVDEESEKEANAKEEKELLTKITKLISGCDVIVFEDYDKGTITPGLIDMTVKMAAKRKVPVVVDPKKRNFHNYRNVDLFKPNLKELREGLKKEINPSQTGEVKKAVSELKKKLSVGGVMLTLSEYGIYIDFKDERFHIPAHTREIADVSGAGDTVVSIAALCVALNLSPNLIAGLSNLGGGLVCEHIGVVPIDKKEFLTEAKKEFQ